MVSWDWNDRDMERWEADEQASSAGRYQEAVERLERERRLVGWEQPHGWSRPVDPPCERHDYGTVDGLCWMCLREKAA